MAEIEIPRESEASRDRFNNWIAIAVALISAFLAVSKVKDDNIVQAMQKAQAQSVDLWNEYQARRQRQVLVEVTIAQTKVQLQGDALAAAQPKIDEWQKAADTFKARAEDAFKKAKDAEATYDDLNNYDDLFDLSDAILSVALALFAVTALVRVRWLFGLATVLALAGLFFGGCAFGGYTAARPEFLIKLLS